MGSLTTFPSPDVSSRRAGRPAVLIVEDDMPQRVLLREHVALSGFRAIETTRPADGLRALESDTSIALVLTDVRLPHKNDGISFIKQVRERWASLPLAAVTGYPDDLIELTDGMVDLSAVVLKPVRASDLDSALHLAAGGGSPSSPISRRPERDWSNVTLRDLRQAIDQGSLVLHYQPEVDMRNQEVVGVEALVRWLHPLRGVLLPRDFLTLAHEQGLIRKLARWVLNTALRQAQNWHSIGLDASLAVNLSTNNLHDSLLPAFVENRLALWGMPASRLTIEVKEACLTDRAAHQALQQLVKLGVRLAVDDFGTGLSSLRLLSGVPLHELKIDRSFVSRLPTSSRDVAIVRCAIDLAHDLGALAVAEGVEDEVTWQLLAGMGCDLAQGNYLAQPLPFPDFYRWLAAL